MSKENLKVVILGGGESGVGLLFWLKPKVWKFFFRIKEKLKRITKRFFRRKTPSNSRKNHDEERILAEIGLSNLWYS